MAIPLSVVKLATVLVDGATRIKTKLGLLALVSGIAGIIMWRDIIPGQERGFMVLGTISVTLVVFGFGMNRFRPDHRAPAAIALFLIFAIVIIVSLVVLKPANGEPRAPIESAWTQENVAYDDARCPPNSIRHDLIVNIKNNGINKRISFSILPRPRDAVIVASKIVHSDARVAMHELTKKSGIDEEKYVIGLQAEASALVGNETIRITLSLCDEDFSGLDIENT
jgi:hypothetical protein